MDLEKLVPLKETCLKLKALGWKTETLLRYDNNKIVAKTKNGYTTFGSEGPQGEPDYYEEEYLDTWYHAPTVSELGEVLPDQFDPLSIHHYKDNSKYTSECFGKGVAGKYFEHENEAEARAQLLIYLIENKHIEL